MRFILLLIPIVFICCSSTPENSQTASVPQPPVAQSSTTTPSNSTEGIVHTGVPDPIKGDPADFTVKINGLQAGTYRLIGFFAEGHFLADSVQANAKGEMRFRNSAGYEQGLYYLSLVNNKFVQILLGKDQKFKAEADFNNINGTIKFEGSQENELYYSTIKYENSFSSRHQNVSTRLKNAEEGSVEWRQWDKEKAQIEQERIDYLADIFKNYPGLLFSKFKEAGQNPAVRNDVPEDQRVYYYRKDFWKNVDFSDPRLIRTPVIFNKLKRFMKELTAQNQDSIFSSAKLLVDQTVQYPEYFKFFANWIVLEFEPSKTTLMDPEAVFVNMVKNYFTRDLAFWSDSMEVYAIQQRANEMGQSLLGQTGPNVISKDQFGETQELYKKTADYLIVYMYNPTCEHCMEETPKLVNWYNQNKNNNIDVFAIAIDTDENEWKDYIKKTGMSFTNVFDPTSRSIYAKYYIDVTPEIYVLNKERKLIGKNLKVDQIDIIVNRDKGI